MTKKRKNAPATPAPEPEGYRVPKDVPIGESLLPAELAEPAPPAPTPVNLGPCRVDGCTSPAVEEINWPNFKGGGGKELYCAAHAEDAKAGRVKR